MKSKTFVTTKHSTASGKVDAAVQTHYDLTTNTVHARAFSEATKTDFVRAIEKLSIVAPIDDTGVLAGKAFRR
jgi:hypothetical protein